MSSEKPLNPGQYFQEWITQWERSVDQFSNKMMETDDFSRVVNSVQNTQLQMQTLFAEMMAKQLATFNMPSREDVVNLTELVQGLDARMAKIEAKLENLTGAIASKNGGKPQGPPRTKRAATKPASKKNNTKKAD